MPGAPRKPYGGWLFLMREVPLQGGAAARANRQLTSIDTTDLTASPDAQIGSLLAKSTNIAGEST